MLKSSKNFALKPDSKFSQPDCYMEKVLIFLANYCPILDLRLILVLLIIKKRRIGK